ncbi:hypothetical protein [Nonomuraea sp. NPDC049725]|uniref:hypothetical protein n=1 Tax=Nonomuraea sp. NPDC049725 TaxID=3154508 RepID=UPI003447F940
MDGDPGTRLEGSLMISVISAVIAVLGATMTAVLGYKLQSQVRVRERIDYMGRYRDALLWAAFDLQSRLYNILHGYEVDRRPGRRGFLRSFLVEGTQQQAEYVRTSTAFLFAEYLGWVEIFRDDLRFLDLGNRRKNRRVMSLLARIGSTLNAAHTSEVEGFRIFRVHQRAIGELMIEAESEPGQRRCIGYAAFCAKLASEERFSTWMQELLDHVDLAAEEPDAVHERLTTLQHQLIDLIDFLDPRRQRFPAEQRSRFAAQPDSSQTSASAPQTQEA